MNPCVTIIVPIYNAQSTLRRCVESVLSQEFTDFELILANDGSKDGSGAICEQFAQADGRVRVLHKENSGVSDTRNQAIAQARGEYLQFLDADDWITPNATKLLAITCAFPLLFVVVAMAISCFKLLGSYYEKYASPEEKSAE